MTDARLAADAVEALAASTSPDRRVTALAAATLAANPSPERWLATLAVQVLAEPSAGPVPLGLTDAAAALTLTAYAEALTLGAVSIPDSPASLSMSAQAEALAVGPLSLADAAASMALSAAVESLAIGLRIIDAAAAVTLTAAVEAVEVGPLTITDAVAGLTLTARRESLHIPGEVVPVADGAALLRLTAAVELLTVDDHQLHPWTADLSLRTLLLLRTGGTIDATPALALPPAGVTQRPVVRRSVVVPNLRAVAGAVVDPATGAVRVTDAAYDALPVTEEVVGVPRVMVNFTDVTYFRGSRTLIGRDRAEEPFGDALLTLTFPQVTTQDTPGSGDLAWMVDGAPVQLVLQILEADGVTPSGPILRLWSGDMISDDSGNDQSSAQTTWQCRGSMWQSSSFVHQVPNLLDPTDIGRLVPKAINNVASRRYPAVPYVATGIMSRERGSWSDSEQSYAQGLLATAWREDGRQWTVGKIPGTVHSYEMRLKKTGSQLTVTNGARGVEVDLSRDLSQNRNVIFGRGIGPDGYAWMNTHYPNLRNDDAPAYPYASAGTVMSIGATDAGTLTGDGVSAWQRRAQDLGFTVTVDGVFSAADAATARLLQRHYGILVDGVVGPQTWAETFDVGGNGGDLSGTIRLPLAADPRTQKWLYRADGSVSGPNPDFDGTVMIVSDDVDFGTGITRAEGVASAQQIIDREVNPPLSGRLALTTDPREKSRFLIEPGERVTLIGYKGADPVLHIAAVERDWQSGVVTLEVDQGSRDAMTLAQIRQRNKDARKDPARRPGNVNKRSRLDTDIATPFDGESGAGWVPKHALYGGLWTVIRVPVSQLGRIAKIDLTTSGPHAKFTVALFGAPITSAALVKYVGNPLTSSDPFGANADTLIDRYGFIEGWGQSGQAAGYYPGTEGDGSLTGRLVDTGGVEYVSQRPPWVWVAEYASTACFISGRILPAAIQ